MKDLAERAIKALERIADATEKISDILDETAPVRSTALGGEERVLKTADHPRVNWR